MDLQENVDLRSYSTMRLGGRARWLATVTAEEQLPRLVELARSKNVPWVMIGHGSNIIWRDEGFNGLVIVNQLLGRKILDEDSEGVTVRLGAGEGVGPGSSLERRQGLERPRISIANSRFNWCRAGAEYWCLWGGNC